MLSPQRRTPSIYYNIDARLWPEGTRVMSARSEIFREDTVAIAECASSLLTSINSEVNDEMKRTLEGTIAPGTGLSLTVNERELAVCGFSLRLSAPDTAAALKGTEIKLFFDGRQTAEVPAGNFFGTGYSYNSYNTRFTGADPGGTLRSSWLMPFRDSCRISIFNKTEDPLTVSALVSLSPYEWNDNSMHFGVSFREYTEYETAGSEHTGGTGLHTDINIADLKGKGLYAGDAMLVFNTADAWWGEGDEKIYVDGESFPSSFGTGTEDYFGYAWCRPELFDHPLIAQPAGYGNFHPGMSVNMRYRILDAIPFTKSLKVDLEMWHWVRTTINFSATAYYYVVPDPFLPPARGR